MMPISSHAPDNTLGITASKGTPGAYKLALSSIRVSKGMLLLSLSCYLPVTYFSLARQITIFCTLP
jgi:hypothetical protein